MSLNDVKENRTAAARATGQPPTFPQNENERGKKTTQNSKSIPARVCRYLTERPNPTAAAVAPVRAKVGLPMRALRAVLAGRLSRRGQAV